MPQTIRRHAALEFSKGEAWQQISNEDLMLGWVLTPWLHLNSVGLLLKLACRLDGCAWPECVWLHLSRPNIGSWDLLVGDDRCSGSL